MDPGCEFSSDIFYFRRNMSVAIEKVLISDHVDEKCQDLLRANGIQVEFKFGLSGSELILALRVSSSIDYVRSRISSKTTDSIVISYE